MIRNTDGSPYKPTGQLTAFQPNGKIQDIFNTYDQEFIQITGTPVYYFEVLIQSQSIDPIYLEDRSKLFKPCSVKLWAFYEPPQQQNMSGLFGIDTPDEEIILEMNYKATITELGHPPKIGSRIYTPHRGENWIIIDYRLDQFKLWGAIRLQVHCKKFQETLTNNDGNVTKINPST